MDVEILASGSSGNALVLNKILLLDCGVPFAKIEPYLKGLRLVFISHRHSDHLNGSTVRRLSQERPTLRFCCGPFLVNRIRRALVPKRQIDALDAGSRYDYGDFMVEPVILYHDAPCYGLAVFIGGESAIYAVDTGYINHVEAKGFDLFLIESNHHESEIAARIAEKQSRGEFAYEQRAEKYHLSHEQAMAWLAENAAPHSKYILLHQHEQRKGEMT